MNIPSNVRKYLENQGVEFDLVQYDKGKTLRQNADSLKIPLKRILRCVTLKTPECRYLAVLPASFMLDYEALKNIQGTEFAIVDTETNQEYFKQCEPNAFPALPELFGFQGIIDESIRDWKDFYIESGSGSSFLKINGEHLDSMFPTSDWLTFACGPEKLYSGQNDQSEKDSPFGQFTSVRIKQRIDETFDLPAMPDIAQDVMKLRVDPAADAKKLGFIIQNDPSLAAQIISWASSPYYGYKGTVDSVETAISRVLGFDLVMNLALGISIGKSLNVPIEGPLGVRSFWRQSIYSASLVEKLCMLMPVKHRPERGLAYLSGLLHNFGHLLLGHLFPPQFVLINRYIEANPDIDIEDVEHFVLGVTHQQIGAWLMTNWHMPEELIVAVRRHHQEEFWSKHGAYSNLVLLAGRLLSRIQVSDSVQDALPKSTLELLKLEESDVNNSFERLLDERESLDIIAKQLVA